MVFKDAPINNMVTLIHGDDITSSRTYYKTAQKADANIFDGEKVTKQEIETFFLSSGLFGDEKQLCLENFFSKRKPSKEMEEIIKIINTYAKASDILLWEQKEITKKISLVEILNKRFALPKSLFLFLDSLKPNNTKVMLNLFHETLLSTETEMILSMLIRQFRILLALSDDNESETIDEVTRMQPWQRKKLLPQAKKFPQKKLLDIYNKLFDLEVKSKTGGLSLPLSESIDFFISSI